MDLTTQQPSSATVRGRTEPARGEEEFAEILNDEPTLLLNSEGSPSGGTVTCPRNWHIFSQKPPHVERATWNAITPDMRMNHIRCLKKLRAMPIECLNSNIANAVIRCVLQDAKARGWRPATVDRELSSMAGALRDLPIYSLEREGIHLKNYPEWNAAKKTIVRMMRESPSDPAAPVTFVQVEEAKRSLQTSCPRAALFLGMMWALAARAGDIASLRKRDVTLETTSRPDGMFGITIAQRYGKGARFRGTYGMRSTLRREEAAELERLLHQRLAKDRLFEDHDDLRDRIRAALRRENRESALTSVRRGAVQHLAAQGVPTEELMKLTGHRRKETLDIYLGYGRHRTLEDAHAQDSAAQLHHPAPSG